MSREPRRNFFDAAEDLASPPEGGAAEAWIYGIVLAVPIMVYGFYAFSTEEAIFPNVRTRGAPLVNNEWYVFRTGGLARATAMVYFFAGLAMHAHQFWGNHHILGRYYMILYVLALLGLAVATCIMSVLYVRTAFVV